MNITLAVVPIALATVDWIAVAKDWKVLRYVAKPAVMLSLLGLLWAFTGYRAGMVYFALGLAFSLLGDIALLLPKERLKSALVFFLLAHLSYIVAYNLGIFPPLLPSLLILLVLVYPVLRIFTWISAGLTLSGNQDLRLPFLVYMLVITGMVFSAITTLIRPSWTLDSAMLTSIGGLLFLYSDSTLAWNRFVKPIPHSRLKVIISYHLAQTAIILAAILQFQTLQAP
jgi:uncharacterized membrane protein YhhN